MPFSPLKLKSYQLTEATAAELGLSDSVMAAMTYKPLRLTVYGDYFAITSVDPVVTIGELQVKDFEITQDQSGIVCYLYEAPKEGAKIFVDYGRGRCGEVAQPFSIKQLDKRGID